MSTVKPGVVGYLKTDDFVPVGSPYGVNQQPAAGSVVADQSKFFSATPATDNTPGGTASFMFLQANTNLSVVSKVLERQFIISSITALKTGADGVANDKAVVSKVSADGLTVTTIGTLDLNGALVNTFVPSTKFTPAAAAPPDAGFTANLGAGETLKVTAGKLAGNCQATVYIHVIGA